MNMDIREKLWQGSIWYGEDPAVDGKIRMQEWVLRGLQGRVLNEGWRSKTERKTQIEED